MWVLGREEPLRCENSIRETELFKPMLLGGRGNLVFMAVETGNKTFGSGREVHVKGYTVVCYKLSL